MTTSQSPLADLMRQADRIAKALKQAERGEVIAPDPAGKVAAARAGPSITVGVAMDDKIIKIEIPWATIRDTDERALSEFIVKYMQGAREQ